MHLDAQRCHALWHAPEHQSLWHPECDGRVERPSAAWPGTGTPVQLHGRRSVTIHFVHDVGNKAQAQPKLHAFVTVLQAGAAAGAGPGPTTDAAPERQLDAVTLPGGSRMPLIGFGTYKVDSTEAIR